MIATAPTTWDALTAFGTIGAVVVAVLGPSWIALRRWSRRPKLELVVGGIEPFLRTKFGAEGIEDIFIRIAVTNNGRTEAKRTRAQTARCWFKSDTPMANRQPWTQQDIDPLRLEWSSQAHGGSGLLAGEVDIAPELTDYLTVLAGKWKTQDYALCAAGGRTVSWQPFNDVGEYRIEVVVYAENMHPARLTVAIRKDIGDLNPQPVRSEAPDPADVEHGGMIGMIQRSMSEIQSEGPDSWST